MYLFAFSWVLFLFGIFACIFAGMHYPIMYTVYSGLTALLFSAFLVYDTQQVMPDVMLILRLLLLLSN
jgi:FtsH-binding integral membrane protein